MNYSIGFDLLNLLLNAAEDVFHCESTAKFDE